jgi:hypothetical protein
MRKFFLMVALFMSIGATQSFAQANGDPATAFQRMKERVKPGLVQQTKITSEQADKAIEIMFQAQRQRREIRQNNTLSLEEKTKRNVELNETREKELLQIPLTDAKMKEVIIYFEQLRKKEQREGRDN